MKIALVIGILAVGTLIGYTFKFVIFIIKNIIHGKA